jgi:sugar phosphate permease
MIGDIFLFVLVIVLYVDFYILRSNFNKEIQDLKRQISSLGTLVTGKAKKNVKK